MKTIIPMAGYCLVEDQEEKLSSGIVLAEEKDKRSQIGKVIDFEYMKIKPEILELKAKNLHITLDDLRQMMFVFPKIERGQLIIYKKYSGNEVELEGKKLKLVVFSDIIGIIK